MVTYSILSRLDLAEATWGEVSYNFAHTRVGLRIVLNRTVCQWKLVSFKWHRVIRISPFANRLSFDAPQPVQRLRCLANYEALRFSEPILTLGETLVKRMKEQSANHGGKYVSVHLRFEEVCSMWRRDTFVFIMGWRKRYNKLFIHVAGHGSVLLLCIWWWQPRKARYGCSKRARMERKIYKTRPCY